MFFFQYLIKLRADIVIGADRKPGDRFLQNYIMAQETETVPKASGDPYTKQKCCHRKFNPADRESLVKKFIQCGISLCDINGVRKRKLVRIQKTDKEQTAAKQKNLNGCFLII